MIPSALVYAARLGWRWRETVRVLVASCSAMVRMEWPRSVSRRTVSARSAWVRRTLLSPLMARSMAVDPAAHQHGVDGRGLHPRSAGDLDRAEPVAPAQPQDPTDELGRGFGRIRVWPRAAVGHARDDFGPVAVGPLLHGLRRDHELLRRSRIRPAAVDDDLSEPQPGAWSQGGISVGHEGLPSVKR